jgi:phosphate starvation-inducible PhoH-like protein
MRNKKTKSVRQQKVAPKNKVQDVVQNNQEIIDFQQDGGSCYEDVLPEDLQSKDQSQWVSQRKKIEFDLRIVQKHKLTDKQKKIIETCEDKTTKAIMIDGLYGTGKSCIAVLASLKLLANKKIDEIIFIRNPVESSTTGRIGFIPGTIEEKMSPYSAVFYDKLSEFVSEADIKRLEKDNRITSIPVGFVRGRSWNCKAIIVDEASSMTWDDLFLIFTRCGMYSKIFFIGDSENQNDIGSKAGFKLLCSQFNDEESREEGIHFFEMKDESDIVRSPLLKFIMKKVGLLK